MRSWLVLFSVVLAAAGCGGGGGGSPAPANVSPVIQASATPAPTPTIAPTATPAPTPTPTSQAASFASSVQMQRDVAQFALTVAGATPELAQFAGIVIAAPPAPIQSPSVMCSASPTADLACSFANVHHETSPVPYDVAEAATVSLDVTRTIFTSSIVFENGTGSTLTGGPNLISVVQTPSGQWVTSGATASQSMAFFAQLGYANGAGLSTLLMSAFYPPASATVTLDALAGISINGSLSLPGVATPLATISVSMFGTGTITYASGATEQITSWNIQGI